MKKSFTHIIILVIVLFVSTISLTDSQPKNGTNTETFSEEYLRSNLIKNIYTRSKEETAQVTSVSGSRTRTFSREVSTSQGIGWVVGYGIPNGINGGIGPMAFDSSGNLYIGGKFRFAGNVEVNNIAKWNGHEWSALGKGIGGVVNTITPAGGDTIIVGGDFENVGDSAFHFVAKWDGKKWVNMCSILNGRVHHIYSRSHSRYKNRPRIREPLHDSAPSVLLHFLQHP